MADFELTEEQKETARILGEHLFKKVLWLEKIKKDFGDRVAPTLKDVSHLKDIGDVTITIELGDKLEKFDEDSC